MSNHVAKNKQNNYTSTKPSQNKHGERFYTRFLVRSKVRSLYLSGMNIAEIAQQCEISEITASKILDSIETREIFKKIEEEDFHRIAREMLIPRAIIATSRVLDKEIRTEQDGRSWEILSHFVLVPSTAVSINPNQPQVAIQVNGNGQVNNQQPQQVTGRQLELMQAIAAHITGMEDLFPDKGPKEENNHETQSNVPVLPSSDK